MALIAPHQAPFLELTAPDDDMEISSDAGRIEHDNDIDLVDGDDDIDYMLEDARSEQGQTGIDEMPDAGRDDIMYDDLDEITYVEDDMHEDVPVPDEHLTDVGEFHETSDFGQFPQLQANEGQTTPTQANSFDSSAANGAQAPDSDTLNDQLDYFDSVEQEQSHKAPAPTADVEPVSNKSNMPSSHFESQRHEQEDVEEHSGTVADLNNAPVEETSTSALSNDGFDDNLEDDSNAQQLSALTKLASYEDAPESVLNDNQHPNASPEHQHDSPKQIQLQDQNLPVQQEIAPAHGPDEVEAQDDLQQVSNDKLEEVPGSEEEPQSLHPVIVDYEGARIYLFRPMHSDDTDEFLLNDSSLADKTLVDLFGACRQVLGDDIDNDLELEIYSEDLDLTISEDSIHCMTTSLSQLVDVYVTLSQQDGVDHPEPFFISMNKKSRWSSRLTALYVAAAESKGLSEVQPEPYPEDYPDDEGDKYEEEYPEQEETTLVQSSTESKFENIEGKVVGRQKNAATNTTDAEPAHGEDLATDNGSVDVEEITQEGEDIWDENLEHNIPAPTEYDHQRDSEDHPEVLEPDKAEAAPEAELEALTGNDSLDQTGGVENDDIESSGSSTVQGENDPHQSSQYSSSNDLDDEDDSWLMEDEDTVHEGSPEHLPPVFEQGIEVLWKSAFDTNTENQASPLPSDGVLLETNDQSNQEDLYPENLFDGDGHFENSEVGAQGWEVIHDDEEHRHDHKSPHEVEPQHSNNNEQFADNEWAGYDEELDFDVGTEEQHVDEVVVPAAEQTTSSGTFRVPDDSAEEEDEDSITYDDDELDLPTQSKTDTVNARSSSQSPLGKRGRDDGEDGGDDGSDQDSKRLKSN